MNKEKLMFGVSTASYQIEGAVKEDGRGECIWDIYGQINGNIQNGDTGEIACDHYHRYEEDVKLIKELAVDYYRLSISWSRIFPEKGIYNEKGIEFYKKLLEKLRENGIKACVTIYHWDLPQWLQDIGGWENRECISYYLEFARKLFEELDDYVDMWVTQNEPYCAGFLAYHLGAHAPGIKSLEAGMKAVHHLLVSHGEAVMLYRNMGGKQKIGIVLNLGYMYPASDRIEDQLACNLADGYTNRWFLEALFHKTYAMDMMALFGSRCGSDFSFIKENDMDVIAAPMDFLGINHYSSTTFRYTSYAPNLYEEYRTTKPKTSMQWDIDPEAFEKLISRVREEYTNLPIYITENGSAWKDKVEDGKVHDKRRIEYLKAYIDAVDNMNKCGMNIKGYFIWSLLDNFEWSSGYSQRFGIVYIDYENQKRIKKDSYFEYKDIIEKHRKK